MLIISFVSCIKNDILYKLIKKIQNLWYTQNWGSTDNSNLVFVICVYFLLSTLLGITKGDIFACG